MTVKAFAKKFEISEDEMYEELKEAGYLKKDYSPKTSFINDGLFDEDGNITDSKTLYSEMSEYFGDSEEDDEDEYDEDESEYEEEDEEDDDDEDDSDEVTIDSIKESLENLSASKEELAELISIITDKLVNFSEEENDEDEDYEEDEDFDEDEDEEEETPKKKSKKSSKKGDDEDPNEPGKYRGWTITKKGITITATKGKKTLTTSVRGNIRSKIDDVED